MPTKSSRCNGSSTRQRVRALLVGLRQDHRAHRLDPVLAEEHVLGPAEPDPLRAEFAARRASAGVSALARTASVRNSSAQRQQRVDRRRSGSARSSAPGRGSPGRSRRRSSAHRRVAPTVPLTWKLPAVSSITIAPQPVTAGLPMPRATTAACEVIPPWAVRMPRARSMPGKSSAEVSIRTRMTASPASPRAFASPVEDDVAARRAGARRQTRSRWHLHRLRLVDPRVEQLLELRRLDAQHRGLLVDQPLVRPYRPRSGPPPAPSACRSGSAASRAARARP